MEKLTVALENCYGIKKLNFEFNFNTRTSSIYAPNGAMKSSLAKTFDDIKNDKETMDMLFPNRKTIRHIKKDDKDLSNENIFVIHPIDNEYKSDKMSTLLVNQELRKKYDQIHHDLNNQKDLLIKSLKSNSGLNKNIEEELSQSFTNEDDRLFDSLDRVEKEVLDKSEPEFDDIKYKNIFNEKVLEFLNTKNFKDAISEYIEKYEELIEASTYFRKGIFNHNNASTIAKNLADNGFFKARHSVSLLSKDRTKKEIKNIDELTAIIDQEKTNILNNPDLVKLFEELDKKLSANKELREFRDYISDNLKILPELKNINSFRQKLWISYLKDNKEPFKQLIDLYQTSKGEISEIVEQAKTEQTKWLHVIDLFNKRFTVPFTLEVENQENVILKSEAPNIRFIFTDPDGQVSVKEPELLQVLSNGEKRALYILNIIFEVEARKDRNTETIFLIDDIADSFDYKNKYAIIEYLKEISDIEYFYQIILTHNFDFFRTIVTRFNLRGKQNAYMIHKTYEKIELIDAESITPFTYFKDHFHENDAILIATIPFARNLFEYTQGANCDDYLKLTSLLHIKENTNDITIKELEDILNKIFHINKTLANHDENVIDMIFKKANELHDDSQNRVTLENKIVLSIAIRLKAESFMISKINDSEITSAFNKNQTYELINLYKEKINDENVEILDQVNLMTPENIHINSFMYEPILDMSDEHLKRLYASVRELN